MHFQKDKIFNETINLIRLSKFDEAKKILLSFEKKFINDSLFYNLLGFVYDSLLDFSNAKPNYLKSLELDSNSYEAKFNLAVLYYKLKNYSQAEDLFNDLLVVYKKDHNSYYNIGIIKFDQKQYDLAISFFKKACSYNPNFYSAYNHLAKTYEELQQYDHAIFYYEKANSVNSEGLNLSFNNLGLLYLTLKNFSKSEELLKQALNLKGEKSIVYNNLGTLYFEWGNFDLAFKYFEEAIILNPKNTKFYSTFLSLIPFCNKEIGYYKQHLQKYRESINAIKNFNNTDYNNIKKLNIGFLSADFKKHPVGYFLLDLLSELYKNNEFKLFALSNSNIEDDYTKKLKLNFHEWKDVSNLEDLELINFIKEKEIHILIDMQGHTYGNRLHIFASKPAPIQISWAAYLASTGIPEINYIVGDPYVTPTTDKNNYIEKIYQLPNIWCSLSTSDIKNVKTSDTPAIKNNYITFGSFNNIYKINDEVIKTWSSILNHIPKSKLILKSERFKDQTYVDNFIFKFNQNNVLRENLIFERSSEREDLLLSYNKIDIALDTFPYTGGTTSLEASWMCVPLLALKGTTFISKCGESININLNMNDWIANNSKEYADKAIYYAKDFTKLNVIRSNLRQNSRKSILFDSKKFSDHFKNAINDIWQNFLK